MAEGASVSRAAVKAGYEPEDVRVRVVLIVVAVSLVASVLIGLALWGMVDLFAASKRDAAAPAVEWAPIETPPPRLQPAPKSDLATYHAREDELLHRWAWVDRSAGIAQIPIDTATAVLAERGWPQPDRPAELVPPRATESPATPPAPDTFPRAGSPSHPPAEISPEETGPSQASPPGGTR